MSKDLPMDDRDKEAGCKLACKLCLLAIEESEMCGEAAVAACGPRAAEGEIIGEAIAAARAEEHARRAVVCEKCDGWGCLANGFHWQDTSDDFSSCYRKVNDYIDCPDCGPAIDPALGPGVRWE